MADTKEAPKAQVTSVHVEVYPNEKGKLITSRKYSPVINDNGDKLRFDCLVIVPETDKQAQELYNLSLAKLIEKGIVQHTYNETVITGMLKDRLASGKAMDTEKFIQSIADAMRTALVHTERETKASEAKVAKDTVAQLYRDYGLDPNVNTNDDLMAAIRDNRK